MADDIEADWLRQQLQHRGIGLQYTQTIPQGQTPLSSIWIDQIQGERTIVHHRDLDELSLAHLQSIDVASYDWLHLEGRNIETIFAYLKGENSIPCSLSMEIEKPRDGIEDLLAFANHVFVSEHYLDALGINAEQCLKRFMLINPQLKVICTLGDKGLLACHSGHDTTRFDAPAVEQIVDSNGAGDSFIAGYIHAMLDHADFDSALEFASRLAADKIQHQGMVISEFNNDRNT